jgi:hypothetical protein
MMEIDPTNPPVFMLDHGVELEVRLILPSAIPSLKVDPTFMGTDR